MNMRSFCTVIPLCVYVWVISALASSVLAGNVSSNIVEKAMTVVAVVVNSAAETVVLRDMAVIAVRNASAAENDMEDSFLLAVRSGDKIKQVAARKKLDESSKSVEESRDMLQKISDLAGETIVAAESARQCGKEIMLAKTERDAAYILKNIQKLSELAVKAENKARAIAENLKKRWLLPLASQPKPFVSPPDDQKVQPLTVR